MDQRRKSFTFSEYYWKNSKWWLAATLIMITLIVLIDGTRPGFIVSGIIVLLKIFTVYLDLREYKKLIKKFPDGIPY